MTSPDGWDVLREAPPAEVELSGALVRRGSRVRLRPRSRRDMFDVALAGRIATVDAIEQEVGGPVHLVCTVDDDPGRDLGDMRMPSHRFCFGLDEVEMISSADPQPAGGLRLLVAGIGNVFLGDDGFGVEVARRMLQRPRAPGVDVVEYGVRGMDLAYALAGYDAAILVDAAPRGEEPGTLALLEPSQVSEAPSIETHGMDPVRVLGLAGTLGPLPPRIWLVVCEPAMIDPEEINVGLSPIVTAALDGAIGLVESAVAELLAERTS